MAFRQPSHPDTDPLTRQGAGHKQGHVLPAADALAVMAEALDLNLQHLPDCGHPCRHSRPFRCIALSPDPIGA